MKILPVNNYQTKKQNNNQKINFGSIKVDCLLPIPEEISKNYKYFDGIDFLSKNKCPFRVFQTKTNSDEEENLFRILVEFFKNKGFVDSTYIINKIG